jgi:NAD(P)-dependent dehydrogenase (short-subunit alcohol dehydrogenase family)
LDRAVTADRARGAVLITGASTGIGAACALHLDRVGFRVWAGVRRSGDGEALLAQTSRRLTPIILDVTDSNSIAAALAGVSADAGSDGLAGLVNNAGIVVAAPVEVLPIAELRKQLEVNVIGLVAVTQAALPLLRRGRGRIVNMGSISGRMATPVVGAYAASKFAVEALTDALRVEVQPWGIDVALIEPGAVATPIWEKSQAAGLALRQAWTPDAEALYTDALSAVERAALRSARHAISPEAVVRAVVHALTAPRPKTRYLVGTAARIQAIVALLPDRLRDRLLTRALRLPPPRAKR